MNEHKSGVGTELKINICMEPIDGFHMSGVDFCVRVFSLNTTKSVIVHKEQALRINDDNNNIYIYSNGSAVQLTGGSACEIVNVGYGNMLPSQTSSILGGGQMIIGKNDNNW